MVADDELEAAADVANGGEDANESAADEGILPVVGQDSVGMAADDSEAASGGEDTGKSGAENGADAAVSKVLAESLSDLGVDRPNSFEEALGAELDSIGRSFEEALGAEVDIGVAAADSEAANGDEDTSKSVAEESGKPKSFEELNAEVDSFLAADASQAKSGADKGANAASSKVLAESSNAFTIPEPKPFAVAFDGSSDEDRVDGEVSPQRPSSSKNLPLDSNAWVTVHKRLCDYESIRRSAYKIKLVGTSAYWASFCALMHSSIDETKRIERMLRGSQIQAARYAEFLKASSSGRDDEHGLDETGMPIASAIDENKATGMAATFRYLSPSKKDGEENSAPDENKATGMAATFRNLSPSNKDDEESSSAKGKSSSSGAGIFEPIYASNGSLATHFANFASYVEEAITEVTNIRNVLDRQVEQLEKVGNIVVADLEYAEAEVVETWAKYYAAAEKLLTPDYFMVEGRRRGAKLGEPVDATVDDFVGECQDLWVEEMQYRMTVDFLSSCWEKSSDELSSLFAQLKHTECQRRFVLRNLAVAYAMQQNGLWSSVAPICTSVLKDVCEKHEKRDPEIIEMEVRDAIRIGAQAVQGKEVDDEKKEVDDAEKEVDNREKEMDGPEFEEKDGGDDGSAGGFGPGLKEVDLSEIGRLNYNPQSPLLSEFIIKADLIEVMGGRLIGKWKTVLAIVTASSYLHIFDLPRDTKVSKDAGPEFAFHALVPAVEIATEEAPKATPVTKQLKDWLARVKPIDSFALPNSSITFIDVKNDHIHQCFDLSEKIHRVRTAGIVGNITTRKVRMRVASKTEEKAWTQALSADK